MTCFAHPNQTSIGALAESPAGLAAYAGWSVEQVTDALAEAGDLIQWDPDEYIFWLPDALRLVPPTNPNVVRGWVTIVRSLPNCALKREIVSSLVAEAQKLDSTENIQEAAQAFITIALDRYRNRIESHRDTPFLSQSKTPSKTQSREEDEVTNADIKAADVFERRRHWKRP